MNRPLSPLPASRWNVRKARHLLNRAGFGEGSAPVGSEELAEMSPSRAVDELVDFEQAPVNVEEPDFLPGKLDFGSYRKKLKEEHPKDKKTREEKYDKYRKQNRKARRRLKHWWLKRIHRTRRPLEEKLTLFWHGHFATESQEVKVAQWNYHLNNIFRQHGAGNVKRLTFEVAKSPAMLRYLDNDQNRAKHPNENWARELLELHTMGLGHYTEADVLESARAFTGWTIKDGEFYFKKSWYDQGTKRFLGQTGQFNGTDIIRIIFQQKPVSGFIALKIWKYFVREEPRPELIKGLAKTLWNANYQLKPMLKQLFRSRYFYSEEVMESKIKTPVQFVVGLLNDLRMKPDDGGYKYLSNVLKKLGQNLFDPPNVSGWDGNRKWVNTSTMLHRYNLPEELMYKKSFPGFSPAELFSPAAGSSTAEALEHVADRLLVRSLDDRQKKTLMETLGSSGDSSTFSPKDYSNKSLKNTLLLMLSSPEYQLC